MGLDPILERLGELSGSLRMLLQLERGRACFQPTKVLRGGPAPLTLNPLVRWTTIAAAAGESSRGPVVGSSVRLRRRDVAPLVRRLVRS